jgi:hypothetical protein
MPTNAGGTRSPLSAWLVGFGADRTLLALGLLSDQARGARCRTSGAGGRRSFLCPLRVPQCRHPARQPGDAAALVTLARAPKR